MKKLIGVIIAVAFFGSLLQVTGILAQGASDGEQGVGNTNSSTCATTTCEQPCVGQTCSCYNTKSSLGKSCDDPSLTSVLVDCEGQDLFLGLCNSWTEVTPKIYKCVNPQCPLDKSCGCYELTPTQAMAPVPGCFDVCTEGFPCADGLSCQDISGGNSLPDFRCVDPGSSCAFPSQDPACWCGEPTPTPTPAICDCNSAIAGGMAFSCPKATAEQPGKAIGGIKIGPIPACFADFNCYVVGADGLRTPVDCSLFSNGFVPTPGWNELDGNRCRVYSAIIRTESPPSECSCDSEICCPRCQEPEEVEGVGSNCGIGCDFEAGGPGGTGCPCIGSSCNQFTPSEESLPPGGGFEWDFGSWEDGQEPIGNASCVEFSSAGVKVMSLTCAGGRKCVKEIVVGCSCTGGNLSPTPGPAEISPGWYKVKDDQLHKWDDIDNPIPPTIQPYDEDDAPYTPDPACVGADPNDIRCLDHNQAGTVSIGGDIIELNGAPISYRQWSVRNYQKTITFRPDSFLEYARARKRTITIDNIQDLVNIEPNTIAVYTGDLTIDDTPISNNFTVRMILEQQNRTPYVLIVQGDLTIDTDFNVPSPVTSSPAPLALIATGDLKIHHFVQTLGGVFIGDSIDFAYDATFYSPYPLKVKGNIAAMEAADPHKRRRTDNPLKPSIYVVFDSPTNVQLLELLSFKTYFRTEEVQ